MASNIDLKVDQRCLAQLRGHIFGYQKAEEEDIVRQEVDTEIEMFGRLDLNEFERTSGLPEELIHCLAVNKRGKISRFFHLPLLRQKPIHSDRKVEDHLNHLNHLKLLASIICMYRTQFIEVWKNVCLMNGQVLDKSQDVAAFPGTLKRLIPTIDAAVWIKTHHEFNKKSQNQNSLLKNKLTWVAPSMDQNLCITHIGIMNIEDTSIDPSACGSFGIDSINLLLSPSDSVPRDIDPCSGSGSSTHGGIAAESSGAASMAQSQQEGGITTEPSGPPWREEPIDFGKLELESTVKTLIDCFNDVTDPLLTQASARGEPGFAMESGIGDAAPEVTALLNTLLRKSEARQATPIPLNVMDPLLTQASARGKPGFAMESGIGDAAPAPEVTAVLNTLLRKSEARQATPIPPPAAAAGASGDGDGSCESKPSAEQPPPSQESLIPVQEAENIFTLINALGAVQAHPPPPAAAAAAAVAAASGDGSCDCRPPADTTAGMCTQRQEPQCCTCQAAYKQSQQLQHWNHGERTPYPQTRPLEGDAIAMQNTCLRYGGADFESPANKWASAHGGRRRHISHSHSDYSPACAGRGVGGDGSAGNIGAYHDQIYHRGHESNGNYDVFPHGTALASERRRPQFQASKGYHPDPDEEERAHWRWHQHHYIIAPHDEHIQQGIQHSYPDRARRAGGCKRHFSGNSPNADVPDMTLDHESYDYEYRGTGPYYYQGDGQDRDPFTI